MALPHQRHTGRLDFLDLFRGLAVIAMIDVHVTNALVGIPEGSRFFEYHERLFNLPAVAFFFAAGITFGIAAQEKWQEIRSGGRALWRRLGRIIQLLALGYLLHLPYFSMRRVVTESSDRQLRVFLSMDVLQCIAYTSLLLLALVFLLPSGKWFLKACVALAVVIAFASPVVWNLSSNIPWWIGTNLSKRWGSNFPLFPYAGFMLAGSAWGYWFAVARKRVEAVEFLRKNISAGLAIFLVALVAAWIPLPWPYENFWNASPVFFALRVGWIALVLGGLYRLESFLKPRLPFLALLGKESLFVYIAHLVVIYGSLVNRNFNLRRIMGSDNSPLEGLAVLAILIAAMVVLARCWAWLKQVSGWKLARLELGLAGCMGIVFLIR